MTRDDDLACHDRMDEPEAATTHHAMDAPADTALDCCASGACADCALVTGALVHGDAATPGFAPIINSVRAPEAPRGRPLSHDPPPPRA